MTARPAPHNKTPKGPQVNTFTARNEQPEPPSDHSSTPSPRPHPDRARIATIRKPPEYTPWYLENTVIYLTTVGSDRINPERPRHRPIITTPETKGYSTFNPRPLTANTTNMPGTIHNQPRTTSNTLRQNCRTQ